MAEPTPQSILFGLPLLEWDSLDAPPYDIAPFSISHSLAQRRYYGVDGATHEHTGRDPIPTRTRLYFINTLREGAFPDLWDRWLPSLLQGRTRDLRHPILGIMRCKVQNVDVDVDANKTIAGIVVDVSWIEDLEDPEEQAAFQPTFLNPARLAAAADSALEQVGIDYPAGGPSNLADLFQQIDGLIFSANAQLSGLINQAKGTIRSVVDTIEVANNVTLHAPKAILTQLYAAALDIEQSLGQALSRATTASVFPHATTLSKVASETGNTVEELMSLNLALLNSPQVPPGTPIHFYSG